MARHENENKNYLSFVIRKDDLTMLAELDENKTVLGYIVAKDFDETTGTWSEEGSRKFCSMYGARSDLLYDALHYMFGESNLETVRKRELDRLKRVSQSLADSVKEEVDQDTLKDIVMSMRENVNFSYNEALVLDLEDFYPKKQYKLVLYVNEDDSYFEEVATEYIDYGFDGVDISAYIDVENDELIIN